MNGAAIFGIAVIVLIGLPVLAALAEWSDDLNNKE